MKYSFHIDETLHFHVDSDIAVLYDFGRCTCIRRQNDGTARMFHVADGIVEHFRGGYVG